MISMSIGAVVLLLFDAFVHRPWSRLFVTALFLILGLASGGAQIDLVENGKQIFQGALFADPLSFFSVMLVTAGTLLTVLIASPGEDRGSVQEPAEWHALLLLSAVGACIFSNAAEMITMFIGLELMSLSLYSLCAAAPGWMDRSGHRHAAEAALKYFILGSFSSAFLLFGIALAYGVTGSTSITEIAAAAGQLEDTRLLQAGIVFMVVGLLFKAGVVPFHFWVPDVYQGSPTPVTAYMASVVKAASVIAGIRVLYGAVPDLQPFWSGILWLAALSTIILANLIAAVQENVKRMLAFSSIAHAGYLMLGLIALREGDSSGAGAAVLYYLVAYGVASIGAFGIVFSIGEDGSLKSFAGLAKRKPLPAFLMLLFLFSLAGLPPGIAGLFGKLYLFSSAIQTGYIWITVAAVLGSVVSLYYYLKVAVYMYFLPPEESAELPASSLPAALTLGICAAAVVLVGLFPAVLYDLAASVCGGFG